MERKRMEHNDIEAVIKGEKDISQFLDMNPARRNVVCIWCKDQQ